MDPKLLDLLACPLCHGRLALSADKSELLCAHDLLAYPVRDGIPVMLAVEARPLSQETEQTKQSEEK